MARPMSKTKILSHIAKKLGTPKKTAALFFDELFKLAVREAKGGAGKFVIPGIGRVVKAHRKARMGRSPQTGEAIRIKARTVVRLRPSAAFRKAIFGGTDDPGPHILGTDYPGERKKKRR
jgi:DNA-binding protein HU-beta